MGALGIPGFVGLQARGWPLRVDTADRVLAFIGYPPLGPAFRLELETYLAVSGTKLSVLGEEALNNPSFVGWLRRGASPKLGTVDRVRAWTAAHASEEEDWTIRALLAEAPAIHPFAEAEDEGEGMNGRSAGLPYPRKEARGERRSARRPLPSVCPIFSSQRSLLRSRRSSRDRSGSQPLGGRP